MGSKGNCICFLALKLLMNTIKAFRSLSKGKMPQIVLYLFSIMIANQNFTNSPRKISSSIAMYVHGASAWYIYQIRLKIDSRHVGCGTLQAHCSPQLWIMLSNTKNNSPPYVHITIGGSFGLLFVKVSLAFAWRFFDWMYTTRMLQHFSAHQIG